MPYKDRDKQLQYQRDHYERQKEVWRLRNKEKRRFFTKITNAIKSEPCQDCGGTFAPCAMQFDHRNPSQKVRNVSSRDAFPSWRQLIDEAAKCDIVCANCHALREYKRRTT